MASVRLSSLKIKILLFSALHLATDGLCAYLIFSRLYAASGASAMSVFLIYNLLAFVTQAPVGIFIDKYNHPKLLLLASVGCILLGYALSDLYILASICLGMGNSLFHVCGGKYITAQSGNDICSLGIFVSTGAVGLVLGQRFFAYGAVVIGFFAVLIIGTALLLLTDDAENKAWDIQVKPKDSDFFIFLAVVAVVVIRSFVGKIAGIAFEASDVTFLIISLATALGKAAGGFCAKYLGVSRTAVASMLLAAACLSIGNENMHVYLLGIFAFNFSMPITLYYANLLLKGREGFAFGVLAASLIPGYFLGMMHYADATRICLIVLLTVASVPAILITSKRVKYAAATTDTDGNA